MTPPDTPYGSDSLTLVTPGTPISPLTIINGKPYSFSRIIKMGDALAQARRERTFPPTTTPNYNVQAIIDDYEDLQRLNAARESASDTRDHAFRPDIAPLYVQIQRKIQDRDLAQGDVAADSNVRARMGGISNGAGAEVGMYNLMRHAVHSVLRLNHLTPECESNVVDAASRVISDIRGTVQSRADSGAHNVDGVNMPAVMDEVFVAIENALGNYINEQVNSFNTITDAQRSQLNSLNCTAQVNAIASHVSAIDNHVHSMGNNVSAMSSLVNSTNSNVTALTSNIGTLQTIVNMVPQMVANSVADILPEAVSGAVHGAVQGVVQNTVTDEFIARFEVLVRAIQGAQARAGAINKPGYELPKKRKRSNDKMLSKKRSWYSRFNIFKKRYDRHDHPGCPSPVLPFVY
ncbi:hypothetical protein F5Y19DRAFT_483348 [Xylariaceae sp. FL1651]|nr:hypothetical protein F5Y19DRAFT_483348 [Xylariaceae sp. FL1651]